MATETRPCDYCGVAVTKTPRQAHQRRSWTCGKSCAGKLRVQAGRTAPSWQPNRFRGQRETRPCSQCGAPITRFVTEQNHDTAWKCSRRCALQAQAGQPRLRRGEQIACASCGATVYRAPGGRGRKYCSAECAHAGLIMPLIDKSCETCSAVMHLRPSEVSKRFCGWACLRASMYSNTIDRIHNGRPVRVDSQGYLLIYEPEYAPPSRRGWALEHRVVMEKHLGRRLLPTEEVDHRNSDRQDNRLENLQALDKSSHRKKTGAEARRRRMTMRERLAEYERRFGPLE